MATVTSSPGDAQPHTGNLMSRWNTVESPNIPGSRTSAAAVPTARTERAAAMSPWAKFISFDVDGLNDAVHAADQQSAIALLQAVGGRAGFFIEQRLRLTVRTDQPEFASLFGGDEVLVRVRPHQ